MSKPITDLRPRWVVLFKKDREAFTLKFNEVYEMVSAISRANSIGYWTKTIPYKGNRDERG